MNKWTKPYHGVTHYEDEYIQATVASMPSVSAAAVYRKPMRTFTADKVKKFYGKNHAQQAKDWAEKQFQPKEN